MIRFVFLIVVMAGSLYAQDPVEDYRVLAKSWNWQDFIDQKFAEAGDRSVELLDFACGTGRWLDEFQEHFLSGRKDVIQLDLLDLSKESMELAKEKMHPPLQVRTLYHAAIQEVDFQSVEYDVVWSTHGFYNIPKDEISSVLQKAYGCLRKNGTLFIAMGTRDSFYSQFYSLYQSVFQTDQIAEYSVHEDIESALEKLGIPYEVHFIDYAEVIEVNDLPALSNFLLHECVGNSFNRDLPNQILELEGILSHPGIDSYLNRFQENNFYYFPQKIGLIKIDL